MDLKKLASLHSGATKVVDSADLDSNDKELFDDIVKRYSGQKTLKLLKNPANGKSLESTLKDFFKKKKVGVSIKGNEVKFIKDSTLKVSDSFEEWSEEEVPEELKSVYSKISEWIENGEGGFEFGEENGAVVYGEFDVDDSHEDDVRSMMEELGYEEVDTDEHHGTYYQFFKKKVKDDSGEEQYDRGLKAGEQARENGWDKEQTLSYYKELQKQFLEGVMKSFEKVTDSFEDLSDEEEKEFESIRGKFDEWVENGDADGYDLLKNGEEIIFEEAFVNNCHGEDVVKMMEKLGYQNTDDWSKHDSVYYSFKKKVTDSVDGAVLDYVDNFIARPLKDGMEIDFSDFVGMYDEKDLSDYIEKESEGKFTIAKFNDDVAIIKEVGEPGSDLEAAKSYFHDDWFATNETLDFKLSDDELNELIEYVQELWDNEEMEGDYPKIEKVEDKIKVTVE